MRTPTDTDMENQKYIYVVFLSTPYRMGKFIRAVTGFPYNHAAISLSPEMKFFYSFSRHYKNAPFYGGFGKESILRCRLEKNIADMMVCAVPVTEEQYLGAKKRLEFLSSHSEEYLYNLISAACFPLRTRVKITKAYTCVEFVLSMLKKYSDIRVLTKKKFCSIKELAHILEKYKIYEGSAERFLEKAEWKDDTFPKEKGKAFYWKKTASHGGKLVFRFAKDSINKKLLRENDK